MASLSLHRLTSLSRLSPRTFHRFYTIVAAKPKWIPRTPLKAASLTPIATVSTTTSTPPAGDSTGNPEIIEKFPNTATEMAKTSTPMLDSALQPDGNSTDWSKSYHGLSTQAFPKEAADILMAPIDPLDIEMKPGKNFLHLFGFLV